MTQTSTGADFACWLAANKIRVVVMIGWIALATGIAIAALGFHFHMDLQYQRLQARAEKNALEIESNGERLRRLETMVRSIQGETP